MKRIFTLLAFAVCAFTASAQTAEEIVNRMDAEMAKYDKERLAMTLDMKIPIIGSISSRSYVIGKKMRVEAEVAEKRVITWSDGTTKWTLDPEKKEVVVENETIKKESENEGDVGMFTNITDGYDVSIKSETDKVWNIRCKKSKSNKEKDDPKTMDLVVNKGTYFPQSLTATLKGITVTMRDLSFDVTEKQVTFDLADYPGYTIVDKR